VNELHLFAGAGGGILSGILCGHTTVCAVEIEPYPRKVLLQRQRDGILPKFPIWDDVCTFDGKPWKGLVDVVCGGFPCQDISSAGKGAGISGDQSGLWFEMARIIGEIRPRYVFVENSPLLVSRGLDRVLSDLAAMGFNAKWGVIGADAIGANHHRKRIWVYADSNEGTRRQERRKRMGSNGRIRCTKDAKEAGLVKAGYRPEKEPGISRMANGLPFDMERCNAIGNGQVPAVAALAWQVLGGPTG